TYVSEAYFVHDDDVAWWVDSGATIRVCKDRCWFKTYKLLNDGSILHMGNESTALVHGRGCVDLMFSSGKVVSFLNVLHVLNIRKNLVSSTFMSTSKLNNSILWQDRLSHVHFKRMQDMSKDGLIPAFDMDNEKTDRGGEYMDTLYFQSVGVSQGFWGEAMLTACYSLNRVPNKRNMITPYELWTKRKPNLNYLRVWGCRAVVRLPDPKLKTLGERGIECIFVGYVKHSNAFRFYVIEPNDSVSINSIIESRDAIFDENRFSSVSRPCQRSLPELRKSKRYRTPKDFGSEFQLYLTEGTRDEVCDQHSHCFNVEDNPKTFDEAIKSQDVAFWKEAINDEMGSLMGNNTWVLPDLPPGCKPLGYKWIFKRKLKVDGTVEKSRQGCLIICQMDMKTTFLNGELDEEFYMNQPQGFIMCNNENKVDLTKEFLSSRFFMKDMGEADVILGIRIKHESNGIAISQSHYIEKILKKFNYFDCTPVSTPMDTSEKLMPNDGHDVSQLNYSRVIGCLMYAVTYTRPDIAFAMEKLSTYTSNHGTPHWQAIQRVLKYLKKTMDYRLMYTSYPLMLEGYTNAS
ncbi:zinc finger, CCHC-type containing protein, partial [Tanacetum coccineum]